MEAGDLRVRIGVVRDLETPPPAPKIGGANVKVCRLRAALAAGEQLVPNKGEETLVAFRTTLEKSLFLARREIKGIEKWTVSFRRCPPARQKNAAVSGIQNPLSRGFLVVIKLPGSP